MMPLTNNALSTITWSVEALPGLERTKWAIDDTPNNLKQQTVKLEKIEYINEKVVRSYCLGHCWEPVWE